jgi:hypothetical protein
MFVTPTRRMIKQTIDFDRANRFDAFTASCACAYGIERLIILSILSPFPPGGPTIDSMLSSYSIFYAVCLWICPMLTAATSGVKRPGDADWIAPPVKFGPSRRPYVQLKKPKLDAGESSVLPIEATASHLNKDKAIFVSAARDNIKDPISPSTSLDRMWAQAGGKDELDKIVSSIEQHESRATLPRLQRPSRFHPYSVARHQYERRKADALKRLAKDFHSVDLLSQLQRARYTDTIEPPSPPRRPQTHEPPLRMQSGHSTLREKWMIPSRSDYWGLRVSTKEAKQAKDHLRYYTDSDAEIDGYLQKLSPKGIIVVAQSQAGSSAIEEIFMHLPPPTSWSNIDHHKIRSSSRTQYNEE